MTPLLLIPAKGHSVRVPRKNLQQVGGKSLIQHAVERCSVTAFGIPVALGPAVITDDHEMALEGLRHGAMVLRNHPGEGTTARVVERALAAVDVDAVVLVQTTRPLGQWRGVASVMSALMCGAAKAVTVDPATGQRTGSAYGALTNEWLSMRDKSPADCWADALLIPSDDGPDVDSQEDLKMARDLYAVREAKAKGKVGEA